MFAYIKHYWINYLYNSDFSLTTWLSSHDYADHEVLPEEVVSHLMSDLGVSSYLQTETCDLYMVSNDTQPLGWKIGGILKMLVQIRTQTATPVLCMLCISVRSQHVWHD